MEKEKISVQVPLTPGYTNKHVTLNATMVTIDLELTDGEHHLISPLMDVGHSPWYGTIQAQLTLWYHYESKNQVLTFYGNDLVSSKSLYLTTVPIGSTDYSLQYTHLAPRSVESINRGWNHNTMLTPGLEEALRETVREANRLIIEQAISLNFNVREFIPVPELDPEIYEQLSSVYHNGKFVEYYDPEKEYGTGYTILPIDSTGCSKMTLKANQDFANVDLSTADPKINNQTWIALWRATYKTVNPKNCTSFNFNGFTCTPTPAGGLPLLYGGHCLFGTKSVEVDPGSNDVFIVPICPGHNNNDNTRMNPIITRQAVSLIGYMNKPT